MTDLPDGFYLKNLQGNFFTRVSVACAPEDIEVPEAHELRDMLRERGLAADWPTWAEAKSAIRAHDARVGT